MTKKWTRQTSNLHFKLEKHYVLEQAKKKIKNNLPEVIHFSHLPFVLI